MSRSDAHQMITIPVQRYEELIAIEEKHNTERQQNLDSKKEYYQKNKERLKAKARERHAKKRQEVEDMRLMLEKMTLSNMTKDSSHESTE